MLGPSLRMQKKIEYPPPHTPWACVVSFGNVQFEYEYGMTDTKNNSHVLSTEDSVNDLGILFKKNLKFDEHIYNTVSKVNRIIGLIKRKFTYIDYGNLVFYPTTKKYKQIVENAQRRATHLVPELRGLTYKERLIELNLPTLDYRRKSFDIIQVFKIVHKIGDIDMSTFLPSRKIIS